MARSVIGEALVRIRPDTTAFRAETQLAVASATRTPVRVSSSSRAALMAEVASIRALGAELDALNTKSKLGIQTAARRSSAGLAGLAGSTVGISLLTGGLIALAVGLRSTVGVAADNSDELRGELDQLNSEAKELQLRIARGLTPAFIGFADVIGDTFRAINNLSDAIGNIPALPDLPGGKGLRGAFLDALPGVGDLRRLGDTAEAINNLFDKAGEDSGKSFAASFNFSAADALTKGLTPDPASVFGEAAQRAIMEDITRASQTIVREQVGIVNAAKQTLADVVRAGNDAVSEAIRQGAEAVRQSAIDARTNLVSIGQGLATDALQLLEEGPLARRIEALRATLDRSQFGDERRRLRQGLSDAERALAEAQRQAETAGPLTPQQTRAKARFLEPFQRDVVDAKAALSEFNTDTIIGRLETQLQAQKDTVSKGIADLIAQFNEGGLSLNALNIRLANLLKTTGIEPFGQAGAALGLAFRTRWIAEFNAMLKQAKEILKGPDVPAGALGPEVVSPADERARQNENIAITQAESDRRTRESQGLLRNAQNDLRKAVESNTGRLENLPKDLAAAIVTALRPGKKPTVAAQPGSSGDRSSGRTP